MLASGSSGNCVLYHNNSIAVDMGISFSKIEPYLYSLQLVLYSHIHGDHLNIQTLKKLSFARPTLRFGIGSFLKDQFIGIKNVDVYEAGKIYDYGDFKISPVTLYHDTPCFGFRIFKGNHKTLHCTDTAHLQGISAKEYDLYALEHNYNEDTVYDIIREQESQGKFAHQRGSINSHLSEQQARDFIFKNRKESSQILRLHETKSLIK